MVRLAVAISLDDSTSNATVPNTDTDVKTYSLAGNNYTSVMMEADVEVVTGLTSTAQAITIKAKIGSTTKSFTIDTLAAVGRQVKHITLDAAQTSSATIAVSHGAPAADANTTTNVFNLYVWGIG